MEDWLLLREYRERGSEAAFTQLVQRHLNLVYGTCLRELRDPDLAADTTQAVFLILARKSARLRPGTVLTGWLYHTARLTARNARRGEARRRAREVRMGAEAMRLQTTTEGEAEWEALEPLLHEALATLKAGDRDAILLRYFEGHSLREVGVTLGISEKGAHMRVTRALEKLRGFFRQRGFLLSTTGLAAAFTTGTALPAGAALSASRITALATGMLRDGAPMSLQIYDLAEGGLREMHRMLLRKIALGVLTGSLVGGGVAVTAHALEEGSATPAPPANAAAFPSATELLRRFGESQARLQSFIITCRDSSSPITGASPTPNLEFRVEGKTGRFTSRVHLDDGGYNSQLWDGKDFYSYAAGPEGPGNVSLDRTGALNKTAGYLTQLRTTSIGASLGYFRFDQQRVDQLLKAAKSLKVRPALEKVGGSECYVLEGTARSGRYTLWLDPQHGYHLVRAEALKSAGDIVLGEALTAGMEVRHALEDVRFEQVEGVWVPMACRAEFRERFPARSPEPLSWTEYHRKLSVQLNPDFDGLRVFRPAGFREGARVYLYGQGAKQHPDYLWRNGKLEPYVN